MRSARIQLVGGVSAIFACLVFLFINTLSSAQTTPISPWLAPASPTMVKISEHSPPWANSILGNKDCQDREVITRPKRYAPIHQTKVSSIYCVTDTGFGAYSGNGGYLQRAGSTVSGLLKLESGGSAYMVPIPKSPTGLRIEGTGGFAAYLYFYDNLEPSIKSTAFADGKVEHRLPPGLTPTLTDRAGNKLGVDYSSIGFSANGEWMVADIPFIGTSRINVKTRDVLPFGPAPNYANGSGVGMKTAISPDGRYAIATSSNYNVFNLYDLSTCEAVPAVITSKVTCKYRDLMPFMRQQIPNFYGVASMRLGSNYSLDLYAVTITNRVSKVVRLVMTADGQQAPGFQYLALGDSFASGEGAYDYKAATDTAENKCHLSQRSYPYLISSALGYGKYESVACSGAVMEDLVTDDKKYTGQANDGFTLESRNVLSTISNMLPGYLPQKEFTRELRPNVITISAGGNDIGFNDIILRCIDTDTCYDNYEDRLQLARLVNDQFEPLTKMYNELKASTDPRAKIYIIGYPQIAATEGTCDMNVHLNQKERVFAEQLVSYLNGVIKKAAEKTGVFYVDVENAFNGRKMCEPLNSWDVAVNGLTAGRDQVNLPFLHGPIGNESFHPNALGHDLLKTKILEKTNNFSAIMPMANSSATVSDPDLNSPFLQQPKTNRAIKYLKHYTGTDGGVIRAGTYWAYEASGLDDAFAAGSKVTAWLNSTPLNLGEYTLAQDGTINIAANIPSSTKPGMHTLHLYGKNSSGEDIDLFKTVFVETGSSCLVPLSGQDADKDGTDDACDGFIDRPPLVVLLPKPPLVIPPIKPAAPEKEAPLSRGVSNTEQTPQILAVQATSATNQQTNNSPANETVVAQASPTQTSNRVSNNEPAQQETQNQPSVLGASTQPEQPKPAETIATVGTAQPPAKSKTLLSYWPIILFLVFVILIVLFTIFI